MVRNTIIGTTALALSALAGCLTAPLASANLVNHWTFDNADTSGLVANDTAGSFANNATWREAAGTGFSFGAAGQVGQAVSLDGDNGTDRVFDVLNGPGGSMEIAGTTALSISMWIQPDLSQNSGATGIFIGRGSTVERSGGNLLGTNQFWGVGWEEFNGDDRRLRADSTGPTRSGALYDGNETVSEWFHVVFTWSGTGADDGSSDPTAVYINGALETSGAVNADKYLSGSWLIGGDPDINANRNFAGLLDDLAVFDNALSAQDVSDIYQGGLNGQNVAQVIPEPSSLALIGLGAMGLLRRRR